MTTMHIHETTAFPYLISYRNQLPSFTNCKPDIEGNMLSDAPSPRWSAATWVEQKNCSGINIRPHRTPQSGEGGGLRRRGFDSDWKARRPRWIIGRQLTTERLMDEQGAMSCS